MYLKKLELIGFKSFADRTEFEFGSGMTCVVGPNGCGKSNVVDAFKWIFGEQSAKGLRGSEMKDVIFNGTQSRKAAGFAEVTAIFDNQDRFFDLDFSEVSITRRLFRSGESVYLINRQKSRLKDIKNLLLGTGLGATSYSIFEQGKIDVMLQASTIDRRIIFEEAAGISKYRARKNETLRALQRTEDNLARVGDVVAELQKQQQRVRSQAGKARRYREYSERLKHLRIRLAVDAFTSSVTERAGLTYQRFRLDFELRRLDGLQKRLRRGLEEHLARRDRKEEELRELRERLAAIRTRRERTEERIEQNRRRLEEINEALERRRRQLEETSAAIHSLREERDREVAEHAGLLGEVEAGRTSLESTVGRLTVLRDEHGSLRGHAEELKRQIVDRMDTASRMRNDLVQLESELSNLTARRERLEGQIGSARSELSELAERAAALGRELETARGEAARLEEARAAIAEEVARIEARAAEVAGELAAAHGELRAAQSRLDVLRTFEENLDGVAKGVASILRECKDSSGVHGLLAHLVEVDSEHAAAVEAALGVRSQALVVDDQEIGLRILDRARELRAGAVEVIALERVDATGPDEIPPGEDVLGDLRRHVELSGDGRPELESLLDALLGRVLLVRDMATALALSRNGLRDFRLVTLDGELVEPPGSLSIAGDSTTGLISRRSEMQDIEGRLVELRARAEALERVRDELEESRREREEKLGRLAAEREGVSVRVASLESDEGQLSRERERLERVVGVAASELSEILEENERVAREREELDRRLGDVDLQRKALESESADLEEKLRTHGEDVQSVAEEVTDARVRVAQSEKREEGLRKAIEQLERTLREREERRGALESEIGDFTERLRTTEQELESSRQALERARSEESECSGRLVAAESEDTELAELEDAFRSEIERVQEQASGLRSEREQVNLEDREGVLRRQSILETVSREYGVDLVELIEQAAPGAAGGSRTAMDAVEEADAPEAVDAAREGGLDRGRDAEGDADADAAAADTDEDPADAETYREPTLVELVGQWVGADDPDWSRDAADEEARTLEEKIRRLGSVNMEALEELDEVDTRLKFQLGQRDDLLKAERDLRQIIAEINKTSRELFTKTFSEVQKYFGEVFERCFSGGKAELVLEDGVDVLEAGIEIVARPPGKKLTSLTLMSGGEKTMTTIALMFAIFKARPSPFCILDEVDAPLDENNVRRFVVLLQGFLDMSQFIIVTHNKITMAVADCLYGVTMEEKGVSKRVSVQFETYDPDNPHESLSTADIDEAPVRQ